MYRETIVLNRKVFVLKASKNKNQWIFSTFYVSGLSQIMMHKALRNRFECVSQTLKLCHYKKYPKQKIKLQMKLTFFIKSLNIQCFSILSLFLCYLLFLRCYCCKLAPFLTCNFLSEYSLILFMNFCIQIHQLPGGSPSTRESREFWDHFHKSYSKALQSTSCMDTFVA